MENDIDTDYSNLNDTNEISNAGGPDNFYISKEWNPETRNLKSSFDWRKGMPDHLIEKLEKELEENGWWVGVPFHMTPRYMGEDKVGHDTYGFFGDGVVAVSRVEDNENDANTTGPCASSDLASVRKIYENTKKMMSEMEKLHQEVMETNQSIIDNCERILFGNE